MTRNPCHKIGEERKARIFFASMNLIILSEGLHATYDGSKALNNRLTLAADTCAFMTRIRRVWTVDGRVGVYEPRIDHARITCVRQVHLLESGKREVACMAPSDILQRSRADICKLLSQPAKGAGVVDFDNLSPNIKHGADGRQINHGRYSSVPCPEGISI